MLSKRSRKLLKWLARQDRWLTKSEIQQNCKIFDDRSFEAITEEKYVDVRRCGNAAQLIQYRIKDKGSAYLQSIRRSWWSEFRAWITLAIAIAAFIQSVIALLMQ